ncbi:DUF397 domain-containing protein [Actinomadura sp. KC345]|uniref:DUF397 domain-containing protein n=1 Tax=Actinomadura sp. KC345 TaxID=2530371 RepID=UPI0010436703|nr:DUF397 domain-containing protein [Actinomadura sp. KC345]TDC57777.1 DUF397 domain-containing protein [Actinomadura sp. KC345]
MNESSKTAPQWRKSSYSGGDSGQCVELASLDGSVGIRDSKNPHTPHLAVGREALSGLLGRIKAGELDF